MISSTYQIKTTLCLNQNKHGRGLLSERISLTGLKHTYNCSFNVPVVLHISLRFSYWIFLLRLSLTWLLFCNGVINGLCYYQKSVGKIWDSSFDEICRYNDSLKLVVISDRFHRKTHPIFCIRISESNITPIFLCFFKLSWYN